MRILRPAAGWLLRCAVLAGLAWAAVWAFRVAAADYYAAAFTVRGLEEAMRWAPGQSLNYVRLSALVSDADPGRARRALEQAVALNPMDARSWIDLGLRHEADGDPAAAERCLLRAAEVDRQYLPSWSLANFYFRTDDTEHFWLWARRAAGMVYGDPTPLFRLADAVAADENLIEKLNLGNLDTQASYLRYLLGRDSDALVCPVSRRLLAAGREQDVPLLLAACDRLLALRRTGEAMELWNRLAALKRIPYGAVSATAADAVINGSFKTPVSSHGFDWRLPEVPGVVAVNEDAPGGIRLTFSGRQPEACTPLLQMIPVVENAHYELTYLYATSGIADGSGLAWNLEIPENPDAAPIVRAIPAQPQESARTLAFDTPKGCRLVLLSLAYRRAPGTTRIDGRIVLRQVRVRPVS